MFMIVIGEDKKYWIAGKTVFSLWYLFGADDVLEKWKSGNNLRECIDRKNNNARFSSKEECSRVIILYSLFLEDFDGPVAFCRKKNYEYYYNFWGGMCNYLNINKIWIHRSSDLKGTN